MRGESYRARIDHPQGSPSVFWLATAFQMASQATRTIVFGAGAVTASISWGASLTGIRRTNMHTSLSGESIQSPKKSCCTSSSSLNAYGSECPGQECKTATSYPKIFVGDGM